VTMRFDELVGRKHHVRWPDEESARATTPPRPRLASRMEAPAPVEAEPAAAAEAPSSDVAPEMTFTPERVTHHRKAPPKKKHPKHQARRSR